MGANGNDINIIMTEKLLVIINSLAAAVGFDSASVCNLRCGYLVRNVHCFGLRSEGIHRSSYRCCPYSCIPLCNEDGYGKEVRQGKRIKHKSNSRAVAEMRQSFYISRLMLLRGSDLFIKQYAQKLILRYVHIALRFSYKTTLFIKTIILSLLFLKNLLKY